MHVPLHSIRRSVMYQGLGAVCCQGCLSDRGMTREGSAAQHNLHICSFKRTATRMCLCAVVLHVCVVEQAYRPLPQLPQAMQETACRADSRLLGEVLLLCPLIKNLL
jgi:hypothetical protein